MTASGCAQAEQPIDGMLLRHCRSLGPRHRAREIEPVSATFSGVPPVDTLPRSRDADDPVPSTRRLECAGVLETDIPLGGSGRRLTLPERGRLYSFGIACTERHVVVRIAVNTPRLGRLYEPTYMPERHVPTAVIVG